MRRILFAAVCLLAFASVGAQVVKTVSLTPGQHLKDVISPDDAYTIDSIAVTEGIIYDEDIRFLAGRCENGKLSGIDLSSVEIYGNSIPDRAFCPSKINANSAGDNSDGSLSKLLYFRLPLNLRKIGGSAFLSTPLREIEIPRTVETIGENAFEACSGLKEVVVRVPDSRCIDASHAFGKNVNAVRLVVPTGTAGSFASAPGWKGFGKISERDGLYSIRRISLDGSGLETQLGSSLLTTDSLVVSGSLNAEDFAAMRKSSADGRLTGIDLTACTVDNNAIPNRAFNVRGDYDTKDFRKLKKLLYVTLPCGITSIGSYAFSGNRQLRCIQIPSSVTYIGEKAYYGCTYASGSVNVPEGVSRLAASTFENSSFLSEVRLPSTLSLLETRSLRLQPNYIESGWHVTFFVNRMTPPKSSGEDADNAFGFEPEDLSSNLRNSTLYVPVGAKPAFEADEVWSCFGNIVETSELDDGTSGIAAAAASAGKPAVSRIYTLDGRYAGSDVNSLGKGVYVVNGKKFVK